MFWATQTYRPWSLAANLVMTKLPLSSTRILSRDVVVGSQPEIKGKRKEYLFSHDDNLMMMMRGGTSTGRNRHRDPNPTPALVRSSSSGSAAPGVREEVRTPTRPNRRRSLAPAAGQFWNRFANLIKEIKEKKNMKIKYYATWINKEKVSNENCSLIIH